MITEGHLARHYQGQKGGRGPAIIDIAQDYLLAHLAANGVFDLGISLKGGTSVRKFYAGTQGRFSTDLDFAGLTDDTAELLLECVHDAVVGPFTFGIEPINGSRRARLLISSPFGSAADIPARLDLGRRTLWLAPDHLPLIPLPVHKCYDIVVPPIPTARPEEVIAEKLARYRRHSLARDLYDLAWFSSRPFDEALVREIAVLKIWCDVVEEGLGAKPYDPAEVLRVRTPSDFDPEAIGCLTRPVQMGCWIESVRTRFAFLSDLDEDQIRISRCSQGEAWLVHERIRMLA